MADNTILKVGIFGAAGYVAYRMGLLSFLGFSPASSTPSTPAIPAPDPNAVVGANSLNGIHDQLYAAVKGPAAVDDWGFALNQILSKAGKGSAPDPMPIFQAAISGFDRGQQLTIAQYWAVMGPALKNQLGLSGMGTYEGLAVLTQTYGRRFR